MRRILLALIGIRARPGGTAGLGRRRATTDGQRCAADLLPRWPAAIGPVSAPGPGSDRHGGDARSSGSVLLPDRHDLGVRGMLPAELGNTIMSHVQNGIFGLGKAAIADGAGQASRPHDAAPNSFTTAPII
jgi:hypothetical protein